MFQYIILFLCTQLSLRRMCSNCVKTKLLNLGAMTSVKIHTKCRNVPYPQTNGEVKRFYVPDDKVSWNVTWSEYKPTNYTWNHMLDQPWADPDIKNENFHPKWNALDCRVNRVSYMGEYQIIDGFPRNPIGRTGLVGRGVLGKWGPNHAADPVVTRWKRDDRGNVAVNHSTKKPILQFVSIQRQDSGLWAFPGGMVDPGEKISQTLKREFSEEALSSLSMTDEEKQQLELAMGNFFDKGKIIFEGYIDDPRNTDNSWMESSASNFHDEDGTSVGRFPLNAGDDAVNVQWKDVDSALKLFASHVDILKLVANMLGANW